MSAGKVASQRPLATVFKLAASAYASSGSRALAAIVLRVVLDPVSVGLVNSLQVLANLFAPLTLGSSYGAARSIPGLPPAQRIASASETFAASVIEGVIVCAIAVPIGSMLMLGEWSHVGLMIVAIPFAVVYRLMSIQESLLLTLQEFAAVWRARLVRTVEPFAGVAAAYVFATPASFVVASTVLAAASLAFRRRAYMSVQGGVGHMMREGFRAISRTDRYMLQISVDRICITAANYMDALLVGILAGPGALAGYYLGVNIRGLLTNLPNAIFWQRWAGSVAAFDEKGHDRFTRVGFLVRLWLAVCAMLAVALMVLWFAVLTVIPRYQPYVDEAFIAAGVSIPIALSAMLRGRRMLDRKVGRLVVFSCVRLALFGGGLGAAAAWSQGPLPTPTIAMVAYAAAGLECLINVLDVSRADRRWRLAAVTAAMLTVPGLGFLWLAMAT